LRGSDQPEESRGKEKDGWDELAEQNEREQEKKEIKGMEIGLQIAWFIRFYGQNTYRNLLYETKDKIIPFKLFYYLSKALQHNMAYEVMQTIQGVSLGVGQVWGGKTCRS
jgi:hypothetical protein